MARVIVTGGAGFIGSHLTDELIKLGHKVIVIDNLSLGKKEYINPKAKFYKIDIRNLNKIKPIFKKADFVFHLAAHPRIQPSIINPLPSFKNNALGTLNVLIASKEAKVKRVIYSASSSVYGDQKSLPLKEDMVPKPKNPYAVSKLIGEQLCKMFSDLYGLDTVSLRYFNVYGPRQLQKGAYATVIGIFLNQLKNRKPLTIVGTGEQKRDFTYISDVVNANILAMRVKRNLKGEVINIGSGKSYSINEVAQFVIFGQMLNRKEMKNIFSIVKNTLTRPKKIKTNLTDNKKAEKIINHWLNMVKYIPPRPGEVKITLADNKKAKRILNWTPKIQLPKAIESLKTTI